MNILIKYIYRNIFEKKLRTVLVILSVALSTSLFFATSSVSDSFQLMYESSIREQVGNADVYISGTSDKPFIDLSNLNIDSSKYRSTASIFEFGGLYGHDTFRLWGADLELVDKINSIEFVEKGFTDTLGEFELVVSKGFTEEHSLSLGDEINIEVNGTPKAFSIVGIAADKNIFSNEVAFRMGVTSLDTANSIFSLDNVANLIYIDIMEGMDIKSFMTSVRKNNDQIAIQETISEEEIETLKATVSAPFYIILSVILIISVFIIYSAFKVIVLERMKDIGTFRSVGATKASTTVLLVGESFLYGLLGSLLGLGLGIGILEVMMGVLSSSTQSGADEVDIVFSAIQVLSSLSIGIIVSILSSLIPILRVNNFPIKDVVLGFHEDAERDGNGKLYVGLGIVMFSLLLQLFVREPDSTLVALGAIIAFILGSILIMPYIIKLFTIFSKNIWIALLGNESLISLKNINSKVLSNNITLFVIGISIILTITSVTAGVRDFIVGAYDSMNYDLKVQNIGDYNDFLEKIEAIEGVDRVYSLLENRNVPLANLDERIITFHGIDPDVHFDFFEDIEILQDKESVLSEIARDNTIILHNTIANRLNLSIGDMIDIEADDKITSLELVGTADTMIAQSGRYAMVNFSTMKNLFSSYSETALLRGFNLESDLKSALRGESYTITSIEDERDAVIDDNMNMMFLLQGFIYMATVVGIFGIINNLVVSFLQRKHDIAVFRSIGMSKKQVNKMFVMEGLFSGLLGGGLGALLGIALISMVPYIVRTMTMPIEVTLSGYLIVLHFVLGGLIILISSSSLMLKSSKVSIIQEIRYE